MFTHFLLILDPFRRDDHEIHFPESKESAVDQISALGTACLRWVRCELGDVKNSHETKLFSQDPPVSLTGHVLPYSVAALAGSVVIVGVIKCLNRRTIILG